MSEEEASDLEETEEEDEEEEETTSEEDTEQEEDETAELRKDKSASREHSTQLSEASPKATDETWKTDEPTLSVGSTQTTVEPSLPEGKTQTETGSAQRAASSRTESDHTQMDETLEQHVPTAENTEKTASTQQSTAVVSQQLQTGQGPAPELLEMMEKKHGCAKFESSHRKKISVVFWVLAVALVGVMVGLAVKLITVSNKVKRMETQIAQEQIEVELWEETYQSSNCTWTSWAWGSCVTTCGSKSFRFRRRQSPECGQENISTECNVVQCPEYFRWNNPQPSEWKRRACSLNDTRYFERFRVIPDTLLDQLVTTGGNFEAVQFAICPECQWTGWKYVGNDVFFIQNRTTKAEATFTNMGNCTFTSGQSKGKWTAWSIDCRKAPSVEVRHKTRHLLDPDGKRVPLMGMGGECPLCAKRYSCGDSGSHCELGEFLVALDTLRNGTPENESCSQDITVENGTWTEWEPQILDKSARYDQNACPLQSNASIYRRRHLRDATNEEIYYTQNETCPNCRVTYVCNPCEADAQGRVVVNLTRAPTKGGAAAKCKLDSTIPTVLVAKFGKYKRECSLNPDLEAEDVANSMRYLQVNGQNVLNLKDKAKEKDARAVVEEPVALCPLCEWRDITCSGGKTKCHALKCARQRKTIRNGTRIGENQDNTCKDSDFLPHPLKTDAKGKVIPAPFEGLGCHYKRRPVRTACSRRQRDVEYHLVQTEGDKASIDYIPDCPTAAEYKQTLRFPEMVRCVEKTNNKYCYEVSGKEIKGSNGSSIERQYKQRCKSSEGYENAAFANLKEKQALLGLKRKHDKTKLRQPTVFGLFCKNGTLKTEAKVADLYGKGFLYYLHTTKVFNGSAMEPLLETCSKMPNKTAPVLLHHRNVKNIKVKENTFFMLESNANCNPCSVICHRTR